MPVYKKCLYCEKLFEIGPEDDAPMKRHIEHKHADTEAARSQRCDLHDM